MEKQPFDDFVIYEKVGNPKTNIYGRSMVSSNNNSRVNNENGRSSDISLEEALKITSYPNYLKDFIKQFLIDNYSDNDMAKIFLIKDNEKIFVIEYALTIELNGRNYKVYVLVYLPILFPNYPPEFYIEKTASLGLNKFYYGKISVPDFKINLESFVKFDPNKNNIEEIINNLVINFTQEFPIYKDNGINNNLNTSAKCILEKSKTSKVILPKRQNNYSRQKTYNNNNSNNNGLGRSYQNNYDNVKTEKFIDNKDEFTDKTFLDFIRKQAKDIVEYNYMEFKEKHNFEENKKKLNTLKEGINQRLNDGSIYGKNDQLKSRLQTLKNIKGKLELIEKNINQEINELKNNDNKSFFDKFEENVNVKNQKDLEYLAKIKEMEDYLVYLKKGYERKIVSFEDMLNVTRGISREIFNLNYMRSKIKSQTY
jgi:hypothetical protein